MADVLKLQNISKIYHTSEGETQALEDISFSAGEDEFISIIGPSGCGKSTILSIIAGLIKKTDGSIFICGKEVEEKVHSSLGYMLQQDHLFPWLTVRENAYLGLEIQKKKTKENLEYVDGLLRQYGLEKFLDAYPRQLSGGMRQRAALIRTLALKPKILLLDEPFSALDYQTRLYVSDDIHSIIKKTKKTAILVTHDISEAISMSDRVIVLTKRPAKIKSIHKIALSGKQNPISRRKAPEFSGYFQTLWEELNEDE